MIFANRRIFVDIDHIEQILEDDGYEEINREDVVAGDVVLYRDNYNNPSHVALVIEVMKLQKARRIKVIGSCSE
jgi:hypothetical protein